MAWIELGSIVAIQLSRAAFVLGAEDMDKAGEGRQQLLEMLGEAGTKPVAEVIAELTYCEVGVRPAIPLAVVLARPDEFRDRLLAEVSQSPGEVDARLSDAPDERHAYFLHALALYVLALWEDHRAFAPLVAYLSADGEAAMDQLDDIVTEDLHAILARLCDGSDLAPLEAIIESPSANPYIRSACLQSLQAMARMGKLPLPKVMAYVEALAGRIEAEANDEFRPLFILDLTNVQDERLRPTIDRHVSKLAADEARLLAGDIDAAYSADYAQLNEELTRRERFDGLIDYVCDWAWFNVEDPSELDWDDDEEGDDAYGGNGSQPLVREGRKIGRNEPCPCGSGLKYKKCCLDKEIT